VQANMTRSGTASALTKTTCSMISRKDIETTLGSSIDSLVFYNVKKWALIRSTLFKNMPPSDLNRFIIAFESILLEDDQGIDPKTHRGFLICLEGKINEQDVGTLFNEDNWTNKTFKCQEGLVKQGRGRCGYLSFSKASEIFD
jgi:hypothetical protein